MRLPMKLIMIRLDDQQKCRLKNRNADRDKEWIRYKGVIIQPLPLVKYLLSDESPPNL